VRYVGQPVVAIVAQTRVQAQDAAELAMVEYQDLRAWSMRRAPSPLARRSSGRRRLELAAEAEMAIGRRCRRQWQPAHVTEIALHNQRLIAMALEPRACIGVHEKGRTTL